MAHDDGPAQRVRDLLQDQAALDEKKMFGGVGFMLGGNMACGVHGDELIVRVGPAAYDGALGQPHARPFDMTGRPMKGWVWVAQDGFDDDADLDAWVQQGVDFALSLPAK
jgi:TfoX/Sxy family transcriptional regulator of competence genes